MQIGLVGRDALIDRARSIAASGEGVLFVGEPGVGKTRLLDETLHLLASDGWHTERFVASAATRSVPFGPLISLLPPEATDRTQQVAGVRRTLMDRADGRRAALAIDDAHLLDGASLACLVDLVHHSEVVLIATVRSTEPTPADLTAIWAAEAIARIDVDPLHRADTMELASRLMRGPVSDELAEQVWDRTRGMPLFVRELLLDAASERLLTADSGTWQVRGQLRTGARLQELVGVRMAALEESARRLLELLTVAEPVAFDLLADGEGAELDGLEQRGLARGEQVAGQWVACVDHPLIAEAVESAIPTWRRRDLVREIARRVVDAGCPAPGDALRAAAWLDECGDPIPAPVAVAAGREALSSLALDRACALARIALEERPRDGHLILGEALRLQAKATEAEAALAVAADLAEDDETIVRVAMWRSTLRAHHADDPEGALALLNRAADRLTNPSRALELRSEAAFLAGLLGRFDFSVDANRRILDTAGIDEPTRWTALMNLLFGHVMLADVSGVDRLVRQMAHMLEVAGQTRAEGVDLYWALVSATQLLGGELARCERELVPHVQRCLAAEELHGITAAILVHPLLYRGSAHVQAMAAAGCESVAQADAYLIAPIAQSGLVIAHAGAGDLRGAQEALADVDESHTGDRRLDAFICRARAAVLALEGRREEAASLVATIGRECVEATYVLFGALAMYDAVRYGQADLVVEDFRRLRAAGRAPLIEVLADHAEAHHRRDPGALIEVARTLASIGAHALVVEALDDAARAASDEVTAQRAAVAAALWNRATPGPHALREPMESALTDREVEVAERVLRGQSSKQVAEEFFLSVRTVDNHLAQVYRKLAVGGRAELAAAVTPVPPASHVV